MNDFGTKTEVKEKDKRLRDETKESRDRAKEHAEEVKKAADALGRSDVPFLRETADRLNEIGDNFKQEANDRSGKEKEQVDTKVDTEKTELSDPVRDGESRERRSAEQVSAAASEAREYRRSTDEAKDAHTDVAEFLKDVAEDSERHQDESRRDGEEITRAAKAAAESLRRF